MAHTVFALSAGGRLRARHGVLTALTLSLLASAALSTPVVAAVATTTFIGLDGSNWSDPANWSNGLPAHDVMAAIINSGTVTVNGNGLEAEIVYLGRSGSGGILVTSDFFSNGSVFGESTGQTGTGVVDGATWTSNGWRMVGGYGTGYLTIRNGGQVTNSTGWIGFEAGSSGTVTVTGTGSKWASGEALMVGRDGTGTMIVSNGGLVTSGPSGTATIGFTAGSSGTVTVTGAGSRWENARQLKVGGSGNGTLAIELGGVVTTRDVVVGASAGGVGSVRVSGTGSRLDATDGVSVGSFGTGTLLIEGGGTVTSNGAYVEGNGGGSGTVTVTGVGSTWKSTYRMDIGSGSMLIEKGGSVENDLGSAGNGGASTLTVTGANSRWQTGDGLSLGLSHTATVTVAAGGTIASRYTVLGERQAASANVLVTGAGSLISNVDELYVGKAGKATVRVENGGTLSSRHGIIAEFSGSTGSVTIAGAGSTWTTSGNMFVGQGGNGTLLIADGGVASSGTVIVGNQTGSQGKIILSGAASRLVSTGTIQVGNTGAGRLYLGGEGAAASAAGTVQAQLVAIGSTGELVFNHTGSAYDFALPLSSATPQAAIKQVAGTTILSADSTNFLGTTSISGGSLRVNGILGGAVNVAGGSLGGTGTLLGAVMVGSGGTLAPGNSIGTLTADNVRFASGSTFGIEVDAAGGSDRLNVVGTATIDNGAQFKVTTLPGGKFGQTTQYTVLKADGGLTGSFTNASRLFFLDPTLTQSGNELVLTLNRNNAAVAGLATGPHQLAAGQAIDTLGNGNPIYDAFIPLDEDEARRLLAAASGSAFAGGQQLIEQTFSQFGSAMGNRQHQARQGVVDTGAPLGYVASAPTIPAAAAIDAASATLENRNDAFWLAPVASFGRVGNDGMGGSTNWATGGLTIGFDRSTSLGDADVLAGVAVGYLHSQADSSASTIKSDAGQIGLYGSWQSGQVRLSGSLAYGIGHSDVSRTIKAGGVDLVATSGAWTNTLGSSLELAYALPLDETTTFAPLVRLDTSLSHRGASTETGAGVFNLDVDASTWAQIDPALGFTIENQVTTDMGQLTMRAGATWQHALLDSPRQAMRFSGTNASFTLAGNETARDRLAVDVGLSLQMDNSMRVFADYAGSFSADAQNHGVRLGLGGGF